MRRLTSCGRGSIRCMGVCAQGMQTAGAVRNASAPAAVDDEETHATQASQRYRRRWSNPETLRERMNFQRDHKYSKRRPLLDVPWRQHKRRTYLDDAERLYGRKETWHEIADDVTRERLVALLQDYLRDVLSATRMEVRDATHYKTLCERARQEYRQHIVTGGFVDAQGLREWAKEILQRGAQTSASVVIERDVGADRESGPADTATRTATAKDTHETAAAADEAQAAQQKRRQRARRGSGADVLHTIATADMPESEARRRPALSAFPFLRQRALTHEDTLDPSLVDWTAKYYPDDDLDTFAQPPQLRGEPPASESETSATPPSSATGTAAPEGDASAVSVGMDTARVPRLHARNRLQRSLREHEDRNRATFDADGVFYRVRRQQEADERAPPPRPVRGADMVAGRTGEGGREIVKVPWDIAATAQRPGYSSDILRAKERLIRLTRGEDPENIP